MNGLRFQIPILVILSLAIHACVLQFIFPGYYSPLYPHHSDFYVPVAQAHSPEPVFQLGYFHGPRPVASFLSRLFGFLGIHGNIFVAVLFVTVNAALSATFFRRILNIEFKWPFVLAFCLYTYLLFSQRHFYVFYTHDNYSHYTYFFLLIGAWLYFLLHETRMVIACLLLVIFSVIAFLCKETYALSALFLAFIWFLYNRKQSVIKALAPGVLIGIALLTVVIYNTTIKSTFTNFSNGATDAYYINLSPKSILLEFYFYAQEGTNAFTWVLVAFFGFLAFTNFRSNKKLSFIVMGCIPAAFLAWLPNALIPNHHVAGYTFNGAYLLYIPLLYFPVLLSQKTAIRWSAIAVLALGFFSTLLNKKEYDTNGWVLAMEKTQRNLLPALDSLITSLPADNHEQKILISGLNMPFYPFHYPGFLQEYPNSKRAVYDVVNFFTILDTNRHEGVKFVAPDSMRVQPYDVAWLFSDQGLFLKKVVLTDSIKKTIVKDSLLPVIIRPDEEKIKKLPF